MHMYELTRGLLTACALAALLAPAFALAEGTPVQGAELTTADDGGYQLRWRSDRPVTFYAESSPFAHDHRQTLAQGGETGSIALAKPADGKRLYVDLASGGKDLVIADRHVALTGATNLRDVGGVRTADGHWVKMGLVFRSDSLAHLTDQDVASLAGLGLRSTYDLRSQAERAADPDRLPQGVDLRIADVAPETPAFGPQMMQDPRMQEYLKAMTAQGAAGMAQLYRRFVTSEPALAAYKTMFHGLAQQQALPTLFHCSAGKDRTGWGAAVLMTLLGVPHEAVMKDYLASNQYLAAMGRAMAAKMPDPKMLEALAPLMTNRPEYLDAAFDEANQRYGSFDGYLHQGLGLTDADIEAIRANFLEG
jgi:protein-tyrosine phosphatase